jgi:hypothetical protein
VSSRRLSVFWRRNAAIAVLAMAGFILKQNQGSGQDFRD